MDQATPQEHDVIELLDEYMTAKEDGGHVDIEELERRAGSNAAELRKHIKVAERVADLSRLIAVEDDSQDAVEQIGRFQTLSVLGTGGYSKVYLADDPELDRQIALKVLPLSTGGDHQSTMAEARSLAKLDHPSVVKVYEVGEVTERGGMAYIAMERVNGPDLRSVLKQLQALDQASSTGEIVEGAHELAFAKALRSTAAKCKLVARIARALAYCHSIGVVHRDLKPENILLEGKLNPKLIDFGMAREESADLSNLTQGLRGTPAYFAPEQVDRGTGGASFASDQFSLGVVLYELLTLAHPFRTQTLNGTMSAISASAPKPIRRRNPAIPLDVDLICSRALSRDPQERYSSTLALAEDLEAFLEHRAVSVRPPSISRQLALRALRYRKYIAVALAACAALISLLIIGRLASFAQERRSLEDFVEFREQAARSIHTPGAFEELFEEIMGRREDAKSLDHSVPGRLVGLTAQADLDHLWGQAVESLERESASPERRIRPSANDESFRMHFQRWGKVYFLVDRFSPDDDSLPLRFLSGAVLLPAEGKLQRVSPKSMPALPKYVEVESWSEPLPSGFYRFSTTLDGEPIEREFSANTDDPAWAPALHGLDPASRAAMVLVPAGSIESLDLPMDDGGPAPEVSYMPFRIAEEVVTWGEFRAAFSEEELGSLGVHVVEEEIGFEDRPAVVALVFAQEFAARRGARLPTAIELFAGARQRLTRQGTDVTSEWTSAVFASNPDAAYALPYAEEGAPDPMVHFHLLKYSRREPTRAKTGFRLATSATD